MLRARIWLPLDGASSWRGNRPPTRRIKPGMGSTGRSRDGLWKLDSSGHGNTSSWRQRGHGAPPCLSLSSHSWSSASCALQAPLLPCSLSLLDLYPPAHLSAPCLRERPGLQLTNSAFYLILLPFPANSFLKHKTGKLCSHILFPGEGSRRGRGVERGH